MNRYISEAERPEVAAAAAGSPELIRRLDHVRQELRKLTDIGATKRTHEHRQQQLMRYCNARFRTRGAVHMHHMGPTRGAVHMHHMGPRATLDP